MTYNQYLAWKARREEDVVLDQLTDKLAAICGILREVMAEELLREQHAKALAGAAELHRKHAARLGAPPAVPAVKGCPTCSRGWRAWDEWTNQFYMTTACGCD
jgi:hypothetical protein